MLWPDTFNNHFHPEVGKATVEVLEAAGFQVLVPAASLCCGRPLYDFGMLDTAKVLLRQILDTLRPQIQAGIPIVGMEPSCVAVFRDELTNLFPDDEDAQRLSQQTFLLSEFLNKKVKDYRPPQLKRKAIVHGHCHHKAIMKMNDEEAILKKLGLDYETPRRRLLRHGRLVRLRERALRRLDRRRRAGLAPRRASGAKGRADHRRRL